MELAQAAGAVIGGLLLIWFGLVVALWLAARREAGRVSLRHLLRVVPDLVVLLRRLARDPELPRGVRLRLVALLAYLALPVDLVPDFVPVVGHADDVVVAALVLRSVVRRAGFAAIEGHWPGTATGLDAVRRLAGLVRDREGPESPSPVVIDVINPQRPSGAVADRAGLQAAVQRTTIAATAPTAAAP